MVKKSIYVLLFLLYFIYVKTQLHYCKVASSVSYFLQNSCLFCFSQILVNEYCIETVKMIFSFCKYDVYFAPAAEWSTINNRRKPMPPDAV
jgi:hypothetical protein